MFFRIAIIVQKTEKIHFLRKEIIFGRQLITHVENRRHNVFSSSDVWKRMTVE